MKTRVLISAIMCGMILSACAGHVEYVRPQGLEAASNVKMIEKPRDQVWASSVPELGKRFFTINNLDKSSGLINVSYTGDPEQFVDCGIIKSFVKNARGERTYEFPGGKAQQIYEIMANGQLQFIDRRMSLEGRVNVIFEQEGPSRTKVTVNTRYVLTRTQTISTLDGRTAQMSDTTAFNSGGNATMGSTAVLLECCVPRIPRAVSA